MPRSFRQIVLGTDRPIGFWEPVHQPRTTHYLLRQHVIRSSPGNGSVVTISARISSRKSNTSSCRTTR
jgi:hypothetical protein